MARTAENRYGSCWSGLPLVRLSINYKKGLSFLSLYIFVTFLNVLGLIKQFMKDTFWGRLDFLIFGKLRYAVFWSFFVGN